LSRTERYNNTDKIIILLSNIVIFFITSQHLLENMMLETTEVRKMDATLKFELVNLLDINDGWKSLMAAVTVDCDPKKSPKYTVDHLK